MNSGQMPLWAVKPDLNLRGTAHGARSVGQMGQSVSLLSWQREEHHVIADHRFVKTGEKGAGLKVAYGRPPGLGPLRGNVAEH